MYIRLFYFYSIFILFLLSIVTFHFYIALLLAIFCLQFLPLIEKKQEGLYNGCIITAILLKILNQRIVFSDSNFKDS